jgi:hypothetical protein
MITLKKEIYREFLIEFLENKHFQSFIGELNYHN